jgi:tight adherence protein C
MENSLFLSACLFLMLMIGITLVGYRKFYKPGRMLKTRLGAPVITASEQIILEPGQSEPETSSVVTFLKQVGTFVPTSELDQKVVKTDLIQAGYRSENAVAVFYGLKIVATLGMLMAALLMQSKLPENPVMRVVLMVSGAGAGWVLPGFFLEKRVQKRQELLRLSLPDALDMLVVSVEAGLGLDQALQHVGRELSVSHPALAEEISLVTLEMRAGKRRADALKNLAERTGEGEIRKLVAILVQNDRFGTSLGESLRTHSDFMRSRRRQDAEERANKVGVKLVFPIFFFILPSMLVVAAGPGLLQIFKYLFPMMKKVGGG